MLRSPISAFVSMGARWQRLSAFRPVANGLSGGLSVSPPSNMGNLAPQDCGACRYRSNRSYRGLYDGKDIRSGNNVSFSMRHTKRKFKPNVFLKRVYSEILDEMIRFHLTAATLRSIDKAGGLDNYLLTSRHITSGEGKVAKERILSKLAYQERQLKREENSID